jgi:streptomycin 3"-adenylyltransferase
LLDLHDRRGSGAGVEMSVVTAAAAAAAAHPMPYELHFSLALADAVRVGTHEHRADAVDPDLAAHITVARARGISLWGPPAAEVFAPMAWMYYRDAVETDIDWALAPGRVSGNPVYLVLNACRLLQMDALGEGTITSKEEGALWAMEALPAYRPLLAAALAHYRSNEPEGSARLDAGEVARFASFVSEVRGRSGERPR